MPEDSTTHSSSSASSSPINRKPKWPFTTFLLLVFFLPVFLGVIIFQLDSFDPVPLPPHELTQGEPMIVPKENVQMLKGVEKIGNNGGLLAPEDIAYDPKSGVIYTGCSDGWINRVSLNDSAVDLVVEKWINTGGRPLGLVNGHHGEVIVADAYKGLLNATVDNTIQVLTDEANGLKFKLTDAVDIAEDGILYFTDASYKYDLKDYNLDLLEGRPYGRLISYDPSTKHTKVLVDNLYFANGVAVSADNHFVIVCETPMRRCKRYYLRGEKQGTVDIFVDNLPGLPDNIMYDGEGLYWIALPTEATAWTLTQRRYPFIRKLMVIMDKYIGITNVRKNGGVIAIDLEGKPVAYYHDQDLSMITSGIKIGDHLYCGSVTAPYILRLNLNQNPAVSIH